MTKSTENQQTALESRLAEALDKIKILEALTRQDRVDEVEVRHSGYGPFLTIPFKDGSNRVIVLSPQKRNRSAVIPFRVYLDIKANTPWIEHGYLYCEADQPTLDNPNLILDAQKWFEGRTEKKLKKDVQEISSIGALNMLYDFTEDRSTGKFLMLRELVAKRLGELLGAVYVEDSRE